MILKLNSARTKVIIASKKPFNICGIIECFPYWLRWPLLDEHITNDMVSLGDTAINLRLLPPPNPQTKFHFRGGGDVK